MTDRNDFIQQEIAPAFDSSDGTYDYERVMDICWDGGLVEFDPVQGYRWAEHDEQDFWALVWDHLDEITVSDDVKE